MFKFFIIILNVFYCVSIGPRRFDDICLNHGMRLYIELGESGVLTALNVSYNASKTGKPSLNATSHELCSFEIVTCPSCIVNVAVRFLDLNHYCSTNSLVDCSCRCDYVLISEPFYEDITSTPFCGKFPTSGKKFALKSRTRALNISLFYSKSYRHAFSLDYSIERNIQLVTGSLSTLNYTKNGVITSPFFPRLYPRDLITEYIITCLNELSSDGLSSTNISIKADLNCRIRLIFSDFQVARVSVIEFYEGNHQRIDVTSGSSFRPPVILSSSPSLTIRFYANGETGAGFKALYSFVAGNFLEKTGKPITDCGGFVEDFGGAITMMNMVDKGIKTYDCLWLIRPPENFLYLKTHLFLKVPTFTEFVGNSELQIRQGLTSELPVLEILRHPSSQSSKEHIIPISSGFYVRLRGTFRPSTQLAIIYAAFSYNKCFTGSEFLCQNHRCISGKLSCDGFDHCGDNSDEPALCYQDFEMELGDRRWYTHTPNYYFPHKERFSDLKTATIVFIVSSLSLIMLISALLILLYKMGSRARQQRDLQSQLQTISELLDEARIEEIVDDPPGYDPPPEYDEVIKAVPYLSAKKKERLKNLEEKRKQIDRSRRSHINTIPVFEILLPAEDLRDQRIKKILPPTVCVDLPSPCNSAACQSRQLTPIPDSPPPPYATGSEMSESESRNDSNDFHVGPPEASECLPDTKAGQQQSWFFFKTTDNFRFGNFSAIFSESKLLDLNLLNRSFHRMCRKNLRKYHSCDDLSDMPDVSDFGKILKTWEAEKIYKEKGKLSQLDIAIENEIKNLINSCSSNSNSNPVQFFPSTSDSENQPRKMLTENVSSVSDKDLLENENDYWEKFDKRFRDPPDRELENLIPKGKKVASLSKKYNSLHEEMKKEELGSGEERNRKFGVSVSDVSSF